MGEYRRESGDHLSASCPIIVSSDLR